MAVAETMAASPMNTPRSVRTVLDLAQRHWVFGGIEVALPSGHRVNIGGKEPGPSAQLELKDYRGLKRVLSGAGVGFAEGYLAGEWDTPDLHALLEAISLNFDRLNGRLKGNLLVRLAHAFGHALHANTRSGSRRNIEAHYDLGNAFYEKWLDPTLSYSSALYESASQPQPISSTWWPGASSSRRARAAYLLVWASSSGWLALS